jgi:hypothetical protein
MAMGLLCLLSGLSDPVMMIASRAALSARNLVRGGLGWANNGDSLSPISMNKRKGMGMRIICIFADKSN